MGKRTWDSDSGNKRDFQIGCPLCAAAVLSCVVVSDRWVVQPHLAVRTWFAAERWSAQVTQPRRFFTPLWPASWVPSVDTFGLLSLMRFGEFGKFMMIVLVGSVLMMLIVLMMLLLLETYLVLGLLGFLLLRKRWLMLSVSLMVLFRRGFCLGRGLARFCWVRLGGPQSASGSGQVL